MSNLTVRGNPSGSGTIIVESPNTNSNRTVTLPDATTTLVGTDATQTLTNKTISGSTVQGGALTLMTVKAWNWNSLSTNTFLDFDAIPSWVKRITVVLDRVSLSGTDNLLVQLGTSSGYVVTGYVGSSTSVSSTSGMIIGAATATREITGLMTICLLTGTRWVSDHSVTYVSNVFNGGSMVDVGGVLDRLRLTVTTTNTFDGGTVNVIYEG